MNIREQWDTLVDDVDMSAEEAQIGRERIADFLELCTEEGANPVQIAFLMSTVAHAGTADCITEIERKVDQALKRTVTLAKLGHVTSQVIQLLNDDQLDIEKAKKLLRDLEQMKQEARQAA